MLNRVQRTLFLSIASFILLILCVSSVAEAAWYNASWLYRKKITIDYTKVSGGANLSYFPMLFTMAEMDLKTIANGGFMGNSGGTDIVFTSSDEVTKIPHEIEKFTDSTGELKAWVRIPTLSCSANTVIYMYYGNAGCADQQDKTGLWNDGGSSYYKGVWHYPDGTSLTANDSTGNGNNGTVTGATATTGPIGGAANFTGTTNSIVTPSTSALNNDIHTISFWFKLNSTSANWTQIMAYRGGGTDRSPGIWVYQAGQNIHWKYDPGNTGTNAIGPTGEGTNFNLGQWYYVVGAKNSGTFNFYVNGVVSGSGIVVANPKTSGNAAIEFGRTGYDSPSMSLDEARVASTARSAGWIATEYNNQSSPATFYSIGVTAGVTWTQAGAQQTPWGPRSGHGRVVFDNKMWVIGGSRPNTTPWQSSETGTINYNQAYNYSMGYKFTPTKKGQITGLYGLFNGTKTVKLYDSSYTVLGSVSITSANTWVLVDLVPDVDVNVGSVYYVVVEGAGSGGATRTSATIPVTAAYATINASVYQSPSGTFNASHTETTTTMYGMVDIQFGGYLNDAWYSTDGINWTEAASTAGWSPRYGFGCLVYDNKIWVIRGNCCKYDVWYSSNGVNWTQATADAGLGGGIPFGNLVFQDKMWIIGKANYNSEVRWSTNGITWTLASAPPWTGRNYPGCLVYDNKMWIMGGSNAGGRLGDVWYTADGNNWTQATASAPWGPRNGFGYTVSDNKMWVIGGVMNSPDCRRSDAWYSTDGTNWMRTTSAASWGANAIDHAIAYKNKIWVFRGCTTGYLWSSDSDYWVP